MINCSRVSMPMAIGTKLSREDNETNFDSTIFRKLVSSLMYLTATRSDIMYGIIFQLVGYTDSDFAGIIDDRKSTSGYAFHLATCLVAWASKKKPTITISSAEVEYVAGTSIACQALLAAVYVETELVINIIDSPALSVDVGNLPNHDKLNVSFVPIYEFIV
ncbi:secreted RxLR effector protein 161-like [Cryptomeria japonica]|uniref:secreted RxLR effector protein 161-like n=1 Tax=Cryptomeria japonica TaxID=3369 RepID=UPI0027DA629A|nr:secreted RxLR effector protein 161-like [Cryptomeria japonica]